MKIKVNLIEGNAKRKHLKIMNFEQLTSYLGLHYNKRLIKDFIGCYFNELNIKKEDIINLTDFEVLLFNFFNDKDIYINHKQVKFMLDSKYLDNDVIQLNIRIYVKANDNGCELLILI